VPFGYVEIEKPNYQFKGLLRKIENKITDNLIEPLYGEITTWEIDKISGENRW